MSNGRNGTGRSVYDLEELRAEPSMSGLERHMRPIVAIVVVVGSIITAGWIGAEVFAARIDGRVEKHEASEHPKLETRLERLEGEQRKIRESQIRHESLEVRQMDLLEQISEDIKSSNGTGSRTTRRER